MATPSLTKHTLPGALGELYVDVRTGERAAPRPAVIVLHGFKGFKDWGMFPALGSRLAQAGFTAVLPNLSGSGADDVGDFTHLDRFYRNTFRADLEDLGVVIDAVAAGGLDFVPPTSIGLVGHSRGGGVAVLAAPQDSRIRAMVTWAAIGTIRRWSDDALAEWRRRGHIDIVNTRTGQTMPIGTDLLDEIETQASSTLDLESAASHVEIPWLLIHGGEDESVPLVEGKRLYQASPRDHTRFLEIARAGHTFGAVHPFKGVTKELGEAMDATVHWLGRHLA